MSRLFLPLVSLALPILLVSSAQADGGRIVLYGSAGPYILTVFSAPSPLRAGQVELSVLVQASADQEPLLESHVEIALAGPELQARKTATHAEATNRWLYVAWFEVAKEGSYALEVEVRDTSGEARAATTIEIGPPTSPLLERWGLLGLPFLLLAIYALHQWRRSISPRASLRDSRLPL